MADEMPKVDASVALAAPLALARQGYQAATKVLAQYPIAETLTKLSEHSVVQQLNTRKEILLALLGLALVLHGSQFRSLLLCTQVVTAFLYERVKSSVMTMYSDIQTVREKMQADAPAPEPEDTSDLKNKYAKKRDEKKKAAENVSAGDKRKEDVEVAKKVLKALDSERWSGAATQVLAAAMACLLVIHGGLAEKVAIAYALVGPLAARLGSLLEFPGYEDLSAWTMLAVRLALWVAFLPLAVIATPLALALNASLHGAMLATEHGAHYAAAQGKIKDADSFIASFNALKALVALTAFGTIWQVWTWAAGGSIAWYFRLLYSPAVIAEGLINLL